MFQGVSIKFLYQTRHNLLLSLKIQSLDDVGIPYTMPYKLLQKNPEMKNIPKSRLTMGFIRSTQSFITLIIQYISHSSGLSLIFQKKGPTIFFSYCILLEKYHMIQ